MSLTTKKEPGVFHSGSTPHNFIGTKPESSHQPITYLSEEPLVLIEPSRSWSATSFRDLWTYQELLYFLVWRDLKVRYKQTVLGVGWVIVQPLLTTLIFTIFLGKLARVPSGGLPYSLLVFAGLLPWTFFANAVANSGNSLVGNANLITKVYFPRIIIPSAAVGARLVDFAVTFILLAGMMWYHGMTVARSMLMLPVLIALITLFSLAFGMWVSAMNVKYRDVGILLPVLIQLWMFVSPVVYPLSFVPAEWQWLYVLNPLVGIVEGFRASLFNHEFNWWALLISVSVTVALLVYSAYAFKRMEKGFADLA